MSAFRIPQLPRSEVSPPSLYHTERQGKGPNSFFLCEVKSLSGSGESFFLATRIFLWPVKKYLQSSHTFKERQKSRGGSGPRGAGAGFGCGRTDGRAAVSHGCTGHCRPRGSEGSELLTGYGRGGTSRRED